MTSRILDISDEPAHLSVRYDQLVIRRGENDTTTMPLSEVAVVVVSHPQTSYTHAVLAGLARSMAGLVVCDEKRLPAAMLQPLLGHSIQTERLALQVALSEPRRKRLWQQIAQAKVLAQGRLLKDLRQDDRGLLALAKRVASGDAGNVEAQASRRYWPALFADPAFRRERAAEDQNRLLNYGYAVLRAMAARAVCAAGLHPSLGLHHHNRYDPFCLADDLMEPFRPKVDRAVVGIVNERGREVPLDKETKAALLAPLTERLELAGEERTLMDVLHRAAASLAQAMAGRNQKLNLPEL